jgi:hypothetical protein
MWMVCNRFLKNIKLGVYNKYAIEKSPLLSLDFTYPLYESFNSLYFPPLLHSFFVAAVWVERKDAEHNRIMNSKI